MSDHRDDRTQPMLLKQASKRGAEEWRHEDAEAVIANLLAALARAEANTAAAVLDPVEVASWFDAIAHPSSAQSPVHMAANYRDRIRAIPSLAPMTVQAAAKVPEVAALMVEAHEASLSLRATGSTRQINQADKVDAALTAMTAQQAARVPEVAARRLTPKQVSALRLLQKHGTPVTADTIHCHDVWYARDVLDRLVKRSLVRRHDFTGGVAPLYEITGLGRAAITEAKP